MAAARDDSPTFQGEKKKRIPIHLQLLPFPQHSQQELPCSLSAVINLQLKVHPESAPGPTPAAIPSGHLV